MGSDNQDPGLAGVYLRSPEEVIALVVPEQAEEVAKRLVKAMECFPETLMATDKGKLFWLFADDEFWGKLQELLKDKLEQPAVPSLVVKTDELFESSEKRFYLPRGMLDKLQVRCPKCGEVTLFIGDYLSYPMVGGEVKETAYCGNDECLHSWEVNYRLDFVLTVTDESLVLPEDVVSKLQE